MADIPNTLQDIDLLWSEGAAYNIGFPHALKTCHSAVKSGGLAVVSELAWLRDNVPAEVREFFQAGYPDMRSADENRSVAEDARLQCSQYAHATQRDLGGGLLRHIGTSS